MCVLKENLFLQTIVYSFTPYTFITHQAIKVEYTLGDTQIYA